MEPNFHAIKRDLATCIKANETRRAKADVHQTTKETRIQAFSHLEKRKDKIHVTSGLAHRKCQTCAIKVFVIGYSGQNFLTCYNLLDHENTQTIHLN